MEEQVNRLVQKTWEKYQNTPLTERLLIAISGIPGSGKTTLATTVVARLNALAAAASLEQEDDQATQIAACIPMDGFHYTRAQLDGFPDAAAAHRRRGAEDTIDGAAFLNLVRRLRAPLRPDVAVVRAPSFSHARKDPVADDIAVRPRQRVVVFEGLYLGLARAPWREAAALMDESWWVEVERAQAGERLVPRHVRAGIAGDEAEARARVWGSDMVNGDRIVEERLGEDAFAEVIVSREDDGWKGD